MVKFLKFCSRSFHVTPIDVVQILWNLADGKSLKSYVIYWTKNDKISPAFQTVATARIAPKICRS